MADTIRLLHVDDQPDFLRASAEFLERIDESFVVETATSPKEGLEILSENQIDCIVSDYEMPRTNGIEFLERVQEEYPALPFVLFTGKGSEEIASEAISAGVTDYLQKRRDTEQYELLANRVTNAVTQHRAEQNIEQVRDFFTGAERLGNLGAWEIDRDGNMIWTEGVYRIHEVEDEFEPTVETSLEFYHPEDRGRVEKAARKARESGVPYDIEARIVTAEGNERWVRTSGEPVDTDAEKPIVRGFIQDITDQKEREGALQEMNHRLRTIISNVPMVLFVLDDEGRFTVAEGRGLETMDVSVDRVVGSSIEEVYGEYEEILDAYDRALDGETIQTTHELDGLFFETTYQPIEESGAVTAVIGVAVDITERREREESLTALQKATRTLIDAEEQEEIYEILVDTGEEILGFDIVAVDEAREGGLVQVASSFDTSDRAHYDSLSLEDDDTFATRAYNDQRTIVTDDIREQNEVEAADSEYRSALTLPVGEYGVFQGGSTEVEAFDETDVEFAQLLVDHARVKLARLEDRRRIRERTAELERQNERLEDLTSFVSHDLRNPLNVASLRLEQARDECESEHLETVAQSHDRMKALIEDLLLLARGEQMVSGIEPVDLASVAEQCWDTVDTADATLRVEDETVVNADRQRLRQLLENLIRNAVEHGGEDVTVTVGPLDSGFYVEDDGPGIPAENREQIFDSGYSSAPDGTGFGMAIVSEIATAHGWEVDVSAATSGGARFEIRSVSDRNE